MAVSEPKASSYMSPFALAALEKRSVVGKLQSLEYVELCAIIAKIRVDCRHSQLSFMKEMAQSDIVRGRLILAARR